MRRCLRASASTAATARSSWNTWLAASSRARECKSWGSSTTSRSATPRPERLSASQRTSGSSLGGVPARAELLREGQRLHGRNHLCKISKWLATNGVERTAAQVTNNFLHLDAVAAKQSKPAPVYKQPRQNKGTHKWTPEERSTLKTAYKKHGSNAYKATCKLILGDLVKAFPDLDRVLTWEKVKAQCYELFKRKGWMRWSGSRRLSSTSMIRRRGKNSKEVDA